MKQHLLSHHQVFKSSTLIFDAYNTKHWNSYLKSGSNEWQKWISFDSFYEEILSFSLDVWLKINSIDPTKMQFWKYWSDSKTVYYLIHFKYNWTFHFGMVVIFYYNAKIIIKMLRVETHFLKWVISNDFFRSITSLNFTWFIWIDIFRLINVEG